MFNRVVGPTFACRFCRLKLGRKTSAHVGSRDMST